MVTSRSLFGRALPYMASMERILHKLWLGIPVLWGSVMLACGPIEVEQLEERAPYIDPNNVNPDRQTIQVRSSRSIEVSTLYDPNDEDRLYVVWMSDERGFQGSFESDYTGQVQLQQSTFYAFEGTAIDLDPCEFGGQQQDETLWLYVSDRRFASTTDESVKPAQGGFLASRAWNIEYFPGNCDRR